MRVAQALGGGKLDKYRVKFADPTEDKPLTIEELSRRGQAQVAAILGISLPDRSVRGPQVARYRDFPQRDAGGDEDEGKERESNQWQPER